MADHRAAGAGSRRFRSDGDTGVSRRDVLAVSTSLTALSGCLDGSDTEEGSDQESDDGPPFEIETIDAPGSAAGTITIPRAGQIALVNFTRQFCPTSIGYLSTVGDAYDRLDTAFDVGPTGELVVVSVIDWTVGATPTDEELADWWREHDGHWPIGIDRSGGLFEAYHDGVFPGTVVIGGDGEIRWRDGGGTTTTNIVSAVRTAIEAEDGDTDSEAADGDTESEAEDGDADSEAEDGDTDSEAEDGDADSEAEDGIQTDAEADADGD